ncbi:cathepsin B-like [Ruditapes philippinarum]|uniref:cathepsin B-like n=1 Tax=Ruditapes philippinarum TaxID=129788 RepID=UPI00295B5132|nr:cathepsin B-like [Ruditapes philippinarum]
MKGLVVLLLVGAACGYRFDFHDDYFSEAFVNYHNSRDDVSWKATTDNFKNVPYKGRMDYIKSLCGAKPTPPHMKLPALDITVPKDLPDTFDARTQWPNCPSLKEVRDQGACGSCWAFGCVEAATDRLCTQTRERVLKGPPLGSFKRSHLLLQNMGNGCNGGFLEGAWDYLKRDGIVTGGPYNSHQGCLPYEIKACDHHVVGKLDPCKGDGPTPRCSKRCEDGYNVTFKDDKHHGNCKSETKKPVKRLPFSLYADFPTYKSGVYEHKSGGPLGGHAIKLLGWGNEDGKEYWLVANSWNPDWGDSGFFKILRGQDECGIESNIVAGMMELK